MLMATVASIYSSSPTPIPPSHSPSPHSVACSSSSIDIEFHPRAIASHHTATRPVLGSLSFLFSTPTARLLPSSSSDITVDTSAFPRRFSQTDLCALLDGSERSDSKERSAVAGPAFCSAQFPSSSKVGGNHGAGSLTVSTSSEKEQLFFPQDSSDLACLEQGSHMASLTDLDIYMDIKPGIPRLTRVPCSSLSEFFCKPLFPEALRTSQDLLYSAQQRYKIFRDPIVIKAFEVAERAHHGQARADGDPYLVHCMETAMLLASINGNKVVVAAGLLHDTIDESSLSYIELQEMFGSEVSDLVEGVTKVSEFSKLARDSGTAYKSVEADRLHTMILAMTDVRVVLIKLADRLHNMRTLGALKKEKRCRIAKETLEVFVPLAGRLGIWSWKAELEDLCFKHLQYSDYQQLARRLSEGFREATIMSAIEKLDEALFARGLKYHDLCGRPKNLYGIYKKMIRKGRTVDDIYDVQGLRLVVASVGECYTALETVHQIWTCIPGKLKDYIKEPKINGYQSLHTVVWGEDGFPLEIQIRTKEMHYQAEFGVAAHWRYKEGNTPHSSFVLQMVEWATWVLTWQNEIMDTKLRASRMDGSKIPSCTFPMHKQDCPHLKPSEWSPCCDDGPLFVIVVEDTKMVVHELLGGSTVADLLQKVSMEDALVATSGIGFWEESRPRVNHKDVEDIYQRLNMGDLVELTPCISEKSVSEYREKLKRIFDDCATQNQRKKASSWQRLSEVAVY